MGFFRVAAKENSEKAAKAVVVASDLKPMQYAAPIVAHNKPNGVAVDHNFTRF